MGRGARTTTVTGGVCRACGRCCASVALVACPDCGGAIAAASAPAPGLLARVPMRHPNHYAWFVLVSALDLMLTWIILMLDGAEVNPIAGAVIDHGGLPSLAAFKFCLVVFIVIMCEWITRRNPRAGRKVAEWSVAITAVPVVISILQLAAEA